MSVTATSNYMSNTEILDWMEQKTEGLYGDMRSSMDVTDSRIDTESALNDLKATILAAKANGGDAAALHDQVNAALTQYKDDPEVVKILQPIADSLNKQYGTSNPVSGPGEAPTHTESSTDVDGNITSQTITTVVKLTEDDVTGWSTAIDGKVADLGKQDQLGLIDIQDLNSRLNQAKQTASALIDSADKSQEGIISHIG